MPAPTRSPRPTPRSRTSTIKVGGMSITGRHRRSGGASRAQDRDAPRKPRVKAAPKPKPKPAPKPAARGKVQADTAVLRKALDDRRHAGDGPKTREAQPAIIAEALRNRREERRMGGGRGSTLYGSGSRFSGTGGRTARRSAAAFNGGVDREFKLGR